MCEPYVNLRDARSVVDLLEQCSRFGVRVACIVQFTAAELGLRELRHGGRHEQLVVGFAGDLERLAGRGYGLVVAALVLVEDRQHAEYPALADAIADIAPNSERLEMQGLGFADPTLQTAQVTEVVQHHRFVTPVARGAKRLERLLQVRFRLVELTFGHVDIGECCRDVARRDAAPGLGVGDRRAREQSARFIVIAPVLGINRKISKDHALRDAIAGLLRNLEAGLERFLRCIAASGPYIYGPEAMMSQGPQ